MNLNEYYDPILNDLKSECIGCNGIRENIYVEHTDELSEICISVSMRIDYEEVLSGDGYITPFDVSQKNIEIVSSDIKIESLTSSKEEFVDSDPSELLEYLKSEIINYLTQEIA